MTLLLWARFVMLLVLAIAACCLWVETARDS